MPIFRIPYTIKGDCYVRAATEDEAIDKAEFSQVEEIVESTFDCKLEIDDYNAEIVSGIPASARLL